ncbi:hypothetical protein EDD76_103168 [Kineothrix alysoides]|uniref:Uncharacterized protein n=1 Tax=Kineothrix alysoides TaxID=1469948 RepID=A0A4V2QCE9_9FIRM|nr:hypothetical protein [Kineothrix alysoides]TCL59977.1 hypothetical protein EDD76_103168 [Kineothrix alysoides]
MKPIKRGFIVFLASVILTTSIMSVLFKPIEAKAAVVAVPAVIETGAVLWNLLMTAFVAAGAYGIYDSYESQQDTFDKFMDYVGGSEVPEVDDGQISTKHIIRAIRDGDIVTFSPKPSGEEPPEDPKDKNGWKKWLKTDKYTIGASVVAAVAGFVHKTYEDGDSKISQELFSVPSPEYGWNGEYDTSSTGDILLNMSVDDGMNYTHARYYFINSYALKSSLSSTLYRYAVYYNANDSYPLRFYQGVLDTKSGSSGVNKWSMPLVWSYVPYAGGITIPSHYFSEINPVASYSTNMPVFSDMEAMSKYLNFRTNDTSSAINPRKEPINYPDIVPQIKNMLLPLITSDSSTGLIIPPSISADALADILARFQEELLPSYGVVTDPSTNPNPNPQPIPEYPTPDEHVKVVEKIIKEVVNPTPNPDTPTVPTPKPEIEPTPIPDNEGIGTDKMTKDWSGIFPFCIPFDIIDLFRVLEATPVAPRWELPIRADTFHINYTFVIDMAEFESLAKIFRTCETILFILGLALITGKVIKW